jgi:hypothetical protein
MCHFSANRASSIPAALLLVAILLAPFFRAYAAKDRIAVLIDQSLYSEVSTKFDRYVQEVEEHFPVELLIYNTASWEAETPENIRDFLIDEYQTNDIQGALLVGLIPFAVWEQSWPSGTTNKGISSIFYEDMDGSFLDTDTDGYYDWHNFGANEGPEIWVCWMRPPESDPDFYLDRLFDKAHSYYTGSFITDKRAFVACHEDYDNNFYGPLGTLLPLSAIYETENVDTDGEGSDLVYEADVIYNLESVGYEIFDTWQHANSTLQAWDSGYTYSSEIMPLSNGSLMTFIYGCHSADFWLAPGSYSSNVNIAAAYPFGTSVGQAASGTSWSYGSEYKLMVYGAMGESDYYLGEAWFEMESYVESRTFVENRYPGREPCEECAGNNLIGNPFLVVKYYHSGDSDSDGMLDRWEYRYRKPTAEGCLGLDRWTHDANADNDGDGYTNYEESVVGTDPTDPDSLFAIVNIYSGSITIEWSSVPGKSYTVLYTDDEYGFGMQWNIAEPLVPASGTGTTTWTDNSPLGGARQRYYRVMVGIVP